MENKFKFRENGTDEVIFTAERISKDYFKVSWKKFGSDMTSHFNEIDVQRYLEGGKWVIYEEPKKKVRGFEVLNERVYQPQRGTKKSAGYDIRAFLSVPYVVIEPNKMKPITTGLTTFMQDDEFLDLRIRSGLAYKYELTLQNDAGVIDADYYGKEIAVMIRNEGTESFTIHNGDRIAQGIFVKYLTTDDDSPADVERDGGFGSTGVK